MNKLPALIRLLWLLVENPCVFNTILKVWQAKLSLLGPSVLAELYESVASVEKQRVPGLFIEAGCALGGSALVIASAYGQARTFFVYDTFAGMPAPSERDGEDVWARYNQITLQQADGVRGGDYYGYQGDLQQRVEKTFGDFGMPLERSHVHLVKGLFQDTLIVTEPVAFAHIDSDWHDSVMVCLQRVTPYLSPGGVMVIDDYYYWSGCRRAVDAYFADKAGQFRFVQRQRLHIVRLR